MSKKKYSKELMKQAVEAVLNGELSIQYCAEQMGVSSRTIDWWVRSYKVYGDSYFEDLSCNHSYTAEQKREAVEAYLAGKGSLREICLKYNISDHSVLSKWVMWYNTGKGLEDYSTHKGNYHMSSRKTTLLERQEIAEFCIENNFNYILTSTRYEVSYTQVYQWVHKYKQGGIDALVDNRGKRKAEEQLSEIELLRRELEETKRQLRFSEIENEVLKKKRK